MHVDAEVRPPATGTWVLPPIPRKEPRSAGRSCRYRRYATRTSERRRHGAGAGDGAFEIVSLLSVTHAAVELRHGFVTWKEWVARLVLSSSRDARAEYWRMLALTQALVAENSSIEPHGLASFWRQVCTESGGRLERRYLTIGLLGLRRLPGAPLDGTEVPWLAGLAHWALPVAPRTRGSSRSGSR